MTAELFAPPSAIYDAVCKFAQLHGTNKYSDDKHMTITATIFYPRKIRKEI